MKRFFLCTLLASSLSLLHAGEPRVVPCDQPVKSPKRGLCLNEMSNADFMAFAPTVSWWYNWHFKDTQNPPAAAKMEFLPMAWGDRAEDLNGLKEYLAKNKPPYVLAINEPNLRGQAFISPEKTAVLYKKIKEIADKHNVPVIGPNMALGSPDKDSIVALDPIENKQITYTFQNPFLKAFFHYLGNVEVPATASHSYGEIGELKWMSEMMFKEFGKPVWITEFANWHAKSPDDEIKYMIQAVEYFENAPHVQGYAWFKERVKDNNKISLLEKQPGKLTKLGEVYVNMPVHDPDLYYQIPGKLRAVAYVQKQDAEMDLTTDSDGVLEMQLRNPSMWTEYNINVPNGGPHSVKFRFSAKQPAKIELLSGQKVLASLDSKEQGWQTAETSVDLPAGNQKLRVRSSSAIRLNWMEFARN